MSITGNLFTTFGIRYPGTALTAGGAGIRENVSDVLENIDPDDTPTLGALPESTVNNLFSDWMIAGLSPSNTAAAEEGIEFSARQLKPRSRLQNWVQRFYIGFQISNDQIELAKRGGVIGVHDAMSHEAGYAARELKRNIECRLWSRASASATAGGYTTADMAAEAAPASGAHTNGSTSITASQLGNFRYWMHGVQWVDPSNTTGSGTLTTGSTVSANVSGAIGTASLYALAEAHYNVGINPNKLFLSPGVKSDLSRALLNDSGLGLARTLDAVKGTEYGPIIEVIRTDFGRLACIVSRHIPQDSATSSLTYRAPVFAIMDTSKVRVAYWRRLQPYSLPPSGDSARAYVMASCTLEVLHPNAIAYGMNVTT